MRCVEESLFPPIPTLGQSDSPFQSALSVPLVTQEGGWKLVHGDVFRPPPSAMLFSACIGTGAQILVLVVTLLMLAVLGTFYQGRCRSNALIAWSRPYLCCPGADRRLALL